MNVSGHLCASIERDLVKVKVKFSRYRPEQALGDPVGSAQDFLGFRHYDGGKVERDLESH
jgi:hypothetical protein